MSVMGGVMIFQGSSRNVKYADSWYLMNHKKKGQETDAQHFIFIERQFDKTLPVWHDVDSILPTITQSDEMFQENTAKR